MKDCLVAKATGSCPLMDGMKGMMKHGKMKMEPMPATDADPMANPAPLKDSGSMESIGSGCIYE